MLCFSVPELILPHLFTLGKNVVHQLGVTLEELYNGSTRKLGLQKNVICEKCEGKPWLTLHKLEVAFLAQSDFVLSVNERLRH